MGRLTETLLNDIQDVPNKECMENRMTTYENCEELNKLMVRFADKSSIAFARLWLRHIPPGVWMKSVALNKFADLVALTGTPDPDSTRPSGSTPDLELRSLSFSQYECMISSHPARPVWNTLLEESDRADILL
jgi:hypothetical protein